MFHLYINFYVINKYGHYTLKGQRVMLVRDWECSFCDIFYETFQTLVDKVQ